MGGRRPQPGECCCQPAQRRLYVIGDRAAWAEHNYFRQLAAALDS